MNEKTTSEVKQTNFRVDTATADRFRLFCEQEGMTQAQGFDHIMQVVELDRAKAKIPERLTEIEDFERLVKNVMDAYLRSVEINANAEDRVREQFAADLDRCNSTIDELRQKADQLQAAKDAAEAATAEAVKAQEQAEKDRAAAEKVRAAAEQTAKDKTTIAEVLTAKLTEAEMKAEGYDEVKAALDSSKDALKAAEQRIKDSQRDAAEAAKDQAREAEKVREQAVREAEEAAAAEKDELKAQIDALKDELRTSKSETDAARKDAETAGKAAEAAKAAAIAEVAEAHRAEVADLRARLDARTDELMQARQEVNDLQMKLSAAAAAASKEK